MIRLRSFVVYVVALAIANYGVLASVSAHAHAHDGWHPVHVVSDSHTGDAHGHNHYDSAPVEMLIPVDLEENDGAPPHTETGFHSHSTPQFGPADNGMSFVFMLISDRALPPVPRGAAPRHREKPPLKPPRNFL